MKRNKLGKFTQELKDPVLLKVQIERYDKSWLDKQSFKRKWSVAKLIRYILERFRNKINPIE